jgi:hypothetical protein
MKFNKIFTMALSLLVATAAFADGADKPTPEDKGKKDYSSWLPAQGDMSVGFSLDPLATFAGNLFNGNLDNTLEDLAGEPLLYRQLPNSCVSIMGTYMLTNELALRANIGFGYSLKQNNFFVQDDAALAFDDLSNAKVIDQMNSQILSGSFSAGIEYRLGKRLPIQGVFGAGLSYACGMSKSTYAYGNAITQLNQNPSMNSEMPATEAVTKYLPNARLLSVQSSDMIHMVGVYGSVGVEWFVTPKVALGANVNLGIYYELNPSETYVYEGWNTITEQVDQHTELVAPASHGFHFGTDNIGASLYMAFYFDTK